MTTPTTPPTPDEQLKALTATVTALQAKVDQLDTPSGGYPPAPEGSAWVPYFSKFAQGAFVVAGVVVGLLGALLFTLALDPDDGQKWDPTRLTNVYLMDIALVFLGLGLALVLGEVARLERVAQFAPSAVPGKEVLEGTLAIFKGLTAGRLLLAIGFILLLSNAYLAKG